MFYYMSITSHVATCFKQKRIFPDFFSNFSDFSLNIFKLTKFSRFVRRVAALSTAHSLAVWGTRTFLWTVASVISW